METRLKQIIKEHLHESGVYQTLIEIQLALFEASDTGAEFGDPSTEDYTALDKIANFTSNVVGDLQIAHHTAGILLTERL